MDSIVAIARGDDKFALLDEAAAQSGFWDRVEHACAVSGKNRQDFTIVIKPNLMIFMSREVPVVATDPALVEHLIACLHGRGFQNVKVVESQNTMNNWVRNRTVANVARVAGYSKKGYDVVDLTLEKVRHTYRVRGLPPWRNWVGQTWRDADYRIDFAKFKTQLDNFYTLCLKNEFGTLPLANKYWHYHTRLPYWACTIYTVINFPVHFGFIDAYRASDGTAGFAVQFDPKEPKMMLAGENIVALDIVGARMMKLDPLESPLLRFALRHVGEPSYRVIGDDTPLEDWQNVSDVINNIVDVGQAIYVLANIGAQAGIINVDTDEFPPRFPLMRLYYKILNWFFTMLHGNHIRRCERRLVDSVVRRECVEQERRQSAVRDRHG